MQQTGVYLRLLGNMNTPSSFELKHSVQPYVVIFIALCLPLFLGIYLGITKYDWEGVWWMLGGMIFYVLLKYFYDLNYSIFYKDKSVIMRVATWFPSAPEAFTTIKISDITSIGQEFSLAQGRATKRIAIYDERHEKFIDVSLKHFTQEDIRKLMRIIQAERPDLKVPMSE